MSAKDPFHLLTLPEVQEEIGRHRWLESEKAGHDVGNDFAAEDWMRRHSKAWMEHHLPEQKKAKKKRSVKRILPVSS